MGIAGEKLRRDVRCEPRESQDAREIRAGESSFLRDRFECGFRWRAHHPRFEVVCLGRQLHDADIGIARIVDDVSGESGRNAALRAAICRESNTKSERA